MSRIKPELLAPAGNFEKLEIAIHFGADAVYLAGKDFGLRSFSGNFTPEELSEAVIFAHARGVKVYIACNIYSRNADQGAMSEYLLMLGKIAPDGVIISDPGVFAQARKLIPQIPIHISTQANTTNYNAALFWENCGAKRIVAARELSLSEIIEITEKTSIEIETFVHGAMCISYSGRCLLSSFMANRESNRGACCHPCRWNYAIVEEMRPGQYFPIAEDERGTYIFNSRDLCMIEHIPEMINSGIRSFKIEGRIKGINYVGSVVRVYRQAIDSYCENPESYVVKPEWTDELAKLDYRGYCTGFYMNDPIQSAPNYEPSVYETKSLFAGKVLGKSGDDVSVNVRNKISVGDKIEIIRRHGDIFTDTVEIMKDESGQDISVAQPGDRVFLRVRSDCDANDLIRRINL